MKLVKEEVEILNKIRDTGTDALAILTKIVKDIIDKRPNKK